MASRVFRRGGKTSFQAHHENSPRSSTEPNLELMTSMTKEQLKIECRKRGQKTSGNKTELV